MAESKAEAGGALKVSPRAHVKNGGGGGGGDAPEVGWVRQLRLLLVRSWRQVVRDRGTIASRAIANISSALIFGSIFFRMKRSQSSIQDRLGLLQVRRGSKTHDGFPPEGFPRGSPKFKISRIQDLSNHLS